MGESGRREWGRGSVYILEGMDGVGVGRLVIGLVKHKLHRHQCICFLRLLGQVQWVMKTAIPILVFNFVCCPFNILMPIAPSSSILISGKDVPGGASFFGHSLSASFVASSFSETPSFEAESTLSGICECCSRPFGARTAW
jgi:hypothetical protein